MPRLLKVLFAFVCALTAAATHAKVEIVTVGEGRWELRVDGKPYEIRGVTFSGTGGPAAYDQDCARLAAIGVNTIRTWGAGKDTQALLDAAHKNGLRVMLGLWFRHGKAGAEGDDSFNYAKNPKGVADQQASILKNVAAYKDHPALLLWGVGNEVYLNMPNDEAKLVYSRALEAACAEIKKLDPDHPLVAVDAATKGVSWIEKHCPSVDAHGINIYGSGIAGLPASLAKAGSTRPWLVTEYGSRGDWDTKPDANGVKLEVPDHEKYTTITDAWNVHLKPERAAGRCLGLFIFNYSNSSGYTNLKHGLLYNDTERHAWYATREIYLGKTPEKPLTRITAFGVENNYSTSPDGWLTVAIQFSPLTDNATGQPPAISFAYNFRAAPTRSQRDAIIPLESRPGPTPNTWLVRAPSASGPVKLYAFVRDSRNLTVLATTSLPRLAAK